MNAKLSITIAVASIMIAVALAPTVLNQGFAAKVTTTTCSGPNGDTSGSCPGNSGSNGNANKCQTSTTKAGNGKGSGEIKDTSQSC
jgi:hypothetical protein